MKPSRYVPSLIERYTKMGLWKDDTPTLLQRLDENATKWPDKEAFIDSQIQMTYAEVKQWTDRVAFGLIEHEIPRDSVILALLPNLVETLLLRFAFQKAGLLGMITPMRFGFRELFHLMKETEAAGLVVASRHMEDEFWQGLKAIRKDLPLFRYLFVVGDRGPEGTIFIDEMAREPLEKKYPSNYLTKTRVQPLEVECLLTTSGTTGLPKAIEHCALPYSMQEAFVHGWKLTPYDIFGALIPLYGGASALCWSVAIWVGGKVVMLEKFDPEQALSLIDCEKITVASGVPTEMVRMVNHPNFQKYNLSSLRYFVYSGTACPPALAQRIEEIMKCKVLTFYGATEVGGVTMLNPDDPPVIRYTSIGKPRPGMEVRLIDEKGRDVCVGETGEITCRGATCPSGYFRDPKATLVAWGGELDGWYRTGDLAKFDQDGYLYLMGRKKDVIIRGGQNIVPAEVENLLCSHPNVMQAAVVPMPDPELGERPCAYVIPKPGKSFSFDEMISFLKGKGVAIYKLPERLEVVDKFPQSGGQKISKNDLVKDITRKLQSEGIRVG